MSSIDTGRIYSRDRVFAAACAAMRINGEYVKRSNNNARYRVENRPDANATKLPNGSIMKVLLASEDGNNILPEDYEKGEEVRTYFCSMVHLIFSGDAREFIKEAVNASTCDEIPENSTLLMLIASLPSCYEKNIKRQRDRESLRELTENSAPLSEQVGQTVHKSVIIVDSIFKKRFSSYAVNALVNDSDGTTHIVFFFDRNVWTKGETYKLSGRIKSKGPYSTQLHYVRQILEKEIK